MGWSKHAAGQNFPKISPNAPDKSEGLQEFTFVVVSGRYGTIKSIGLGCAVFTASRSMIGPGNRFNTLKYDLKTLRPASDIPRKRWLSPVFGYSRPPHKFVMTK
jgi:hypothetical protein